MLNFTLTTSTGLKRTAKASRPAGVLWSSSAGAEQTGSVVIERRPSYREYSYSKMTVSVKRELAVLHS